MQHLPRFDRYDWIFRPPTLLLLWSLCCRLLNLLLFYSRSWWGCWGEKMFHLEQHLSIFPIYTSCWHSPSTTCRSTKLCINEVLGECKHLLQICFQLLQLLKKQSVKRSSDMLVAIWNVCIFKNFLPRFLGQWSGQPPPAEAEVCRCWDRTQTSCLNFLQLWNKSTMSASVHAAGWVGLAEAHGGRRKDDHKENFVTRQPKHR